VDPRQFYSEVVKALAELGSVAELPAAIDVRAPLAYQYFQDAAEEYAKLVAEKLKAHIQAPRTAKDGTEACVKAIIEACRKGERRRECLQLRLLERRLAEKCAELWIDALRNTLIKYTEVRPS